MMQHQHKFHKYYLLISYIRPGNEVLSYQF